MSPDEELELATAALARFETHADYPPRPLTIDRERARVVLETVRAASLP